MKNEMNKTVFPLIKQTVVNVFNKLLKACQFPCSRTGGSLDLYKVVTQILTITGV